MQQLHIHSSSYSALQTRARFRADRTFHPPRRYLPILALGTRESPVVDAADMQRYRNDVCRCMGMSVARAEANQLRKQAGPEGTSS